MFTNTLKTYSKTGLIPNPFLSLYDTSCTLLASSCHSIPKTTFNQYYQKNTQTFEKEFHQQLTALTELIYYEFDGGYWGNEYGSISSNFYEEEKSYDFMENGYHVCFFPSQIEDIVFFKIIPVHPQIKASFLQSNEKRYDGFICSHNKHRLYKHRLLHKPMPKTFCHYEDVLQQTPIVVYLSSITH